MSHSKRSRKNRLMGNHQRSWIWGRHAVLEALRSDRWCPLEVRASHQCDEETRFLLEIWQTESLASSEIAGIAELKFESDERLKQLCSQPDHQGLIARMPDYPYVSAAELRENLSDRSAFLFLDELQDAYNFGACLRCAEVFGMDAVVVGRRSQCGVTSQVVRSSAGAVHHLPIARTDDLASELREFREAGLMIVAASEKATSPLPAIDFQGPSAIVIGNEGTGISDLVLAECSHRARIPQRGRVSSLNAAVASGIVCYELMRQRELLLQEPNE